MFHYVMCLLCIPLFICLYLYQEGLKKNVVHIAITMYLSTMILNILFYTVTGYSLLNGTFNFQFYILYSIGYYLISKFLNHILNVKTTCRIPIYKWSTTIVTLLFTNVVIYFLWLLSSSGRMAFEIFIYNLITPINTETADFTVQVGGLILFAVLMSICSAYSIQKYEGFQYLHWKQLRQHKKKEHIFSFMPMMLLIICIYLPFYTFHLEDAYTYLYMEDAFIEEHYVNPINVNIRWPDAKRNLLYVFVESFESSYFSKELGGLNNENLLPNLTKLMYEGVYFSNHENAFGGAVTMPQANVTISGMVASLSGVNYKIPINVKEQDVANVLPGVITLNDLLAQQGYKEYFMLGSYINAYHIGTFYRQHGNALTIGLDEKIDSGELPVGYKVWWGFEDRKLYDFAKNDLLELNDSEEPFMYVIATNDTHREGGYTDESCNFSYQYPMQNAIACTDQMLSEFLEWVMEQPFYENTTVVIVGDHLGHEEEYVNSLQPQEDRRVFNLILNSASKETGGIHKPRDFWAGDMFPTVLSSLGVEIEGNQLGLGVNLFSDKPTFVELFGREKMTSSLEKNSEFYNLNFLLTNSAE